VFRLGVASVRVGADSWSIALSLTNLTRHVLTVAAEPVRVCAFDSPDSTRSRCLAASHAPSAPVHLRPGEEWRADPAGQGRLAAGEWLRVLVPVVSGSFSSPTGPIIAWMTIHAYQVGSGRSVARSIGTGP
jgi:hypothetical protein